METFDLRIGKFDGDNYVPLNKVMDRYQKAKLCFFALAFTIMRGLIVIKWLLSTRMERGIKYE